MIDGKIGVCVIGAGRAGMIHARNFRASVPFAKMTCVVDPVESAAKAACAELEIDKYYLDYRRALEDKNVDAVVIVTPTVYHRDITVAAAEAGRHILCEKPMAMNENECIDMQKAAEKANIILQIGFMRRYDDNFVFAQKSIERGEIGDVVMVRSNTRGPSVPQPWMYDIAKSNGPLAEVNSHDIDTLRWFTSSEFERVYAIGGNYRSPAAKADFPDFYDNVIMNATFRNGCQGQLDGAQGVGYGYDARVEILGTKGVIYLGNTRDNAVTVCSAERGITETYTKSWRTLFEKAYENEDRHFIECICSGESPRSNGHDGRMAVRVVCAGNRSIREKTIVEV